MAAILPFPPPEVQPELPDPEDNSDVRDPQQEKDPRLRRCATVPRRLALHSEWLPDLDYYKLVGRKTPLYRRSSSHPFDDSTLYKCAIRQHSKCDDDSQNSKEEGGQFVLEMKKEREAAFMHLKEMLCETLKLPLWHEDTGFFEKSFDCNHAIVDCEKQFYLMANQLFIYGQVSTVCALCTRRKREYPESHIFPEGLLHLYRKIHCEDVKNFIYNPSKQKVMGAGTLTLPLFCSGCEKKACIEENFLRRIYLAIMGTNGEHHLRITEDESHKLRHILAVLLFRGMLVGINFREARLQDYSDAFFYWFFQLRNYCLNSNMGEYREMAIAKRIHLFLLPNASLDIRIASPAYILDFQLRNPEFTTIFHPFLKEPCLYMKFDCFHCVIPLTGDGNINLPGPHAKLGSCLSPDFYDDGRFTFPNYVEAKQLFPTALLKYNMSQVNSLLHQFLGFPKSIDSQPFCIVKLPLMMYLCTPSQEKYPSQERGEVVDIEQLNSEKTKALLEEAKRVSPLEVITVEFKKLLKTNTESYRNSPTRAFGMLQVENYHLSERTEKLQKEIENLKQKNKTLSDNNRQLKEKEKELEKKLEQVNLFDRQLKEKEKELEKKLEQVNLFVKTP